MYNSFLSFIIALMLTRIELKIVRMLEIVTVELPILNFCDLAKLPKPLSGCLSKKQLDEIRQWVQQYGKSVRQNTTRNFSTKDKPGTLPLNLYESAPPEQHSVDLDVLLNEDIPVQHQDTSTSRNIVIAQSTYVVVSLIYKPRSAPNSPLYIMTVLVM